MHGSKTACGHPGCKHGARKVVKKDDKRNGLGKTHDCCARCCSTLKTRSEGRRS